MSAIEDRIRDRVERLFDASPASLDTPEAWATWKRRCVSGVAAIIAEELVAMGVGRTRAGVAHPVTPDASKGDALAPAGSDPAPSPPTSCPDGLLPDGSLCPRCGGLRAPSGTGGGTWVHFVFPNHGAK